MKNCGGAEDDHTSVEFVVVAATLMAVILYLATTADTVMVMVTVAAAWGLWGVARLDLPEYARYALALILLLPALATVHLIQDGMTHALLAVPALVRAALLVSFHHRILSSVMLIMRDVRGKADR